jgi:hypothetical protein
MAAGSILSSASGYFSQQSQASQQAGESGTGSAIAAGVLAVGSVIQNFFFHPDCSKLATSAIVNQAEQFLKQNLAAWQALPAKQRTPATQAQALANFDGVWQQVVQACEGTGQYGTAGQACVGDRQRGACHYQPQPGQYWNWFVGYRDPIANDPAVAANAAASPLSSIAPSILPASVTSSLASAGIDPTRRVGDRVSGGTHGSFRSSRPRSHWGG